MAAARPSRLSYDLTTTREETIDRLSGWGRAIGWEVTWLDDRFAIAEPDRKGNTLFGELIAGSVVARDGGSRLHAGLGSVASGRGWSWPARPARRRGR